MITPTHIETLKEAIQVASSAATHNTKMGRTVMGYSQQQRADALKDVLEALGSCHEVANLQPIAKAGDVEIFER